MQKKKNQKTNQQTINFSNLIGLSCYYFDIL